MDDNTHFAWLIAHFPLIFIFGNSYLLSSYQYPGFQKFLALGEQLHFQRQRHLFPEVSRLGSTSPPVPRRPWFRPQLSESEQPLEPRVSYQFHPINLIQLYVPKSNSTSTVFVLRDWKRDKCVEFLEIALIVFTTSSPKCMPECKLRSEKHYIFNMNPTGEPDVQIERLPWNLHTFCGIHSIRDTSGPKLKVLVKVFCNLSWEDSQARICTWI